MNTVEGINAAIAKLSRKDLWRLKEQVDRRCEADWDAQIAEDARAGGPLDSLARKAMADFKNGRCKPLP